MSEQLDGDAALRAHVRALHQEIGINEDFLENLFKEPDDWSFVIKLNALVEAALTHLLTDTIGRPELRDAFANTDLASTRSGKIVFASALGLMDSEDRRFVIKRIHDLNTAFATAAVRALVSLTGSDVSPNIVIPPGEQDQKRYLLPRRPTSIFAAASICSAGRT